jgi:DNA ligase-1
VKKDQFPPLFVKTKTGKINVWSVWADGNHMITEWGQLGGKLQQSRKTSIPTNVGKANERDGNEQASFDAGSLWRQKKDEGYSESPEEAKEAVIFLPMLAHKVENLDKLKGKGFDLQPKLDGVRCLAYWENGEVCLMSRGGKPYSVPHIQLELSQLLPVGYILDGEIWAAGLSCQTVTSYVKKTKPGTEKLKYHVFDLPSAGMWETRRDALQVWFDSMDPTENVVLVPTLCLAKVVDIEPYHDLKVMQGYEGAIIRLHSGTYEWGERSRSLMKYKKFQDAEFEVIGVRNGEGKLSNAAVFKCKNDLTDDHFDVIFAGTLEQREEQWKNAATYMGKMLTVRFFDRTDDKLPRFPVGKVFRSKEDM